MCQTKLICLNCFDSFDPRLVIGKKCLNLECNHDLIEVDKDLAPIIETLNRKNIITSSSGRLSYNNSETQYEWYITFAKEYGFKNLPQDFYFKDKTLFLKINNSEDKNTLQSYIERRTSEFLEYTNTLSTLETSKNEEEEEEEEKNNKSKQNNNVKIGFLFDDSFYNVSSFSKAAFVPSKNNKDFQIKNPAWTNKPGIITTENIIKENKTPDFNPNKNEIYYGIIQKDGSNLNIILSSFKDVDIFLRTCQLAHPDSVLSLFKNRKMPFEIVIFTPKEVTKTEDGLYNINRNNCIFL